MVKSYFGVSEPDVQEFDANEGGADADAEPFALNGKLYMPAWSADVGRELEGDGRVIISMGQETCGLFVSLSPVGARQFADCVVKAAERAELEE